MSRRFVSTAAVAALCAACVAFDPNGPSVPHLSGRYTVTVSVAYHNDVEALFDSVPATVLLPDAGERGFFLGWYRSEAGDSGVVGGTVQPDGTLHISEFAQPPLATLQGATFLHRLYPWCDFTDPAVGTGALVGQIRGDSLLIDGGISLYCTYLLWEQPIRIATDMDVRITGTR